MRNLSINISLTDKMKELSLLSSCYECKKIKNVFIYNNEDKSNFVIGCCLCDTYTDACKDLPTANMFWVEMSLYF